MIFRIKTGAGFLFILYLINYAKYCYSPFMDPLAQKDLPAPPPPLPKPNSWLIEVMEGITLAAILILFSFLFMMGASLYMGAEI